jgi:hypothetical protein
MYRIIIILHFLLLSVTNCLSQAIPDSLFLPAIADPIYPSSSGPVIHIDEAHHNYHTAAERFFPFAKCLQADGYRIAVNKNRFTPESLEGIKILVISNAIHQNNLHSWNNPVLSAFDSSEVSVLQEWVENGGRLFLIADHMPFGGAARELASVFGFELCNCFAMDSRKRRIEYFTRSEAGLSDNDWTREDYPSGELDSIVSFTGSAFKIPKQAIPVLKLNDYRILSPEQAWQFNENTKEESSEDYYQLAVLKYGNGKVILSGEAAMFTAQLAGATKVGMNSEEAKHNISLLRKLMRWLSKDLPQQ